MVKSPVIVVAPDSFKGSLSASAVCRAISGGLARALPNAELRCCPMADGGEGTLDALLSRGGARRSLAVSGAGGRPRSAAYGVVHASEGELCVLEAAEVVGITDTEAMSIPVTERSTKGLGELLRALLDAGQRRFAVGLGGTATNDGGAGFLSALGLRLLDAVGREVPPTPRGLARLASVDAASFEPRLAECSVTILSDVAAPLAGEGGATTVFGPQKGVAPGEVATIDAHLSRYGAMVEAALGHRAAESPGAGAAGGLGFALAVLGGTFTPGAARIAELVGLDAALSGADWAITGEGRSDAQTLLGKVPSFVAERAQARGVTVTLLSGSVDSLALPSLGRVFAGCFGLPAGPLSLAECIGQAEPLLADRAEQLARLWQDGWQQRFPR
jgi:glycerate kinase